MKYYSKILLALAWSVSLSLLSQNTLATQASEQLKAVVNEIGEEQFTDPGYHQGLIKHIVLFRYKENTTQEIRNKIQTRFLQLKDQCVRNGKPYILSIETGTQNSGEGLDQEFEQIFIVTFASEGARNYYVGKDLVQHEGNFDPAHDAFKKFVGSYLKEPINPLGAFVVDFTDNI